MAVFVVGIHTTPQNTISNEWIRNSIDLMFSLAVPFFFATSGYLLFRNILSSPKLEYNTKIRRYTSKIIRMYVVWTIIYIPFTIYGFSLENNGLIKDVAIFIRNFILVGENLYSWPLWYLLGLIYAVGIIYLLLKMHLSVNSIAVIGLLFALAGLGIEYLHTQNPESVKLYYKIFLTTRNGFFVGFPCVAMGLWTAKCKNIPISWIVLALTIGILLSLQTTQLSSMALGYCLFLICIRYNMKISTHHALFCRNLSTIIYLTHMFWVTILWQLLNNQIAVFTIAVLLSICIGNLLLRCRGKSNMCSSIYRYLFT